MIKKIIIAAAAAALLIFPTTVTKAQHYVKSGESMWSIARDHGMFFSDLIRLNPQVKNPNLIYPNQFLTVREGDLASQIVDYALALKPVTQYQYGGNDFSKTPYKADCSAWTAYIYEKFGVVLPRVSWEQARAGEPLTFQQLRKGDLMFFGQNGRVSHVGIFMGDYNGKPAWISNLSTGKDVVIYSIYETWTQQNFLYGGRVL